MTALHYAVKQGERKVVELLLQAGANVSATTLSGETPIDFADQFLKQLLESGG